MGTKFRNLRPAETFADGMRWSIAVATGGLLSVGALNTSGVIPARYRSLVIITGVEAAFFAPLTLLLAYYHRRWKLGFFGIGNSSANQSHMKRLAANPKSRRHP
jgi:hypothetical protein